MTGHYLMYITHFYAGKLLGVVVSDQKHPAYGITFRISSKFVDVDEAIVTNVQLSNHRSRIALPDDLNVRNDLSVRRMAENSVRACPAALRARSVRPVPPRGRTTSGKGYRVSNIDGF